MGVQSISGHNATIFIPGWGLAGKEGAGAEENFAELVQASDVQSAADAKAKQRAIAKERVAEIGFAKFAEEQREIQKIMRVLTLFRDTAPKDIQQHLEKIIGNLEQDPPRHPQEMYARIEAYIDRLPNTLPNDLKGRLKDVYRRMKELMAKPDEELERLEKAGREERMRRSGNVFGFDPAIF
jgi:hypothetical protein